MTTPLRTAATTVTAALLALLVSNMLIASAASLPFATLSAGAIVA